MTTDRRAARRPARLSRKQRIRFSVVASVVGAVAVTVAAIWIESVRETDLGDERAGVTERLSDPVPEAARRLRLASVGFELGLRMQHGTGERRRLLPEDTGSGLAWGDYDGDGDPDLYVVDLARRAGATTGGNRLFRNDRTGFVDVTDAAGVGDVDGMGMGATFADFDDDGDLDLHVTNNGPDRLFENAGDGTFRDVAERVGVAVPGWSVGAAWGDVDGDGDLDLYVCSYVDYQPLPPSASSADGSTGTGGKYIAPAELNPKSFDPIPNHLFLNDGAGHFDDAGEQLGVHDPGGRSFAATLCDLDGDGLLDLYVNNDASPNALFLGRRGVSGELCFEDASLSTGTADPRGSMGLSVADVIGPEQRPDGVPDLFVTHWVTQQNALYEGTISPQGTLLYRDLAQRLRLGEISRNAVGWGAAFVDLDADGRRDLVVANGSTLEDDGDPPGLVPQAPFLFWNGAGRFHDVAASAGEAFAAPRVARGLAVADYDLDGDVDVAVLVNRGPLLLFRNDTPRVGRTLAVRLLAPPAERHGARVRVIAGERVLTWWYGADVSYASQHDADAPVGLGEVAGPVDVEVRWNGGRVSRLTGVEGARIDVR